jgi:membrane-bound lytic murein transglycosylase D
VSARNNRRRWAWRGAAAVLALAVASCATLPRAPPHAPAAERHSTSPAHDPALIADGFDGALTAVHPAAPEPAPGFWTRLRAGFVLDQCDDPPVQRETARWTQRPQRLAAQIERALPWLMHVQREVAAAGLPGEFALLPFIESGYRAVPGRGAQPAGPWQIVPVTARAYGLAIRNDYDARLDVVASTRAATRLLRDLGARFDHDWVLADMAYNAGEYRVRRALRAHAGKPSDPFALALPPITHRHVRSLLGLACAVRDPEQHALDLPEPRPEQELILVAVEATLQLELAARMAGLGTDELRALNPASRGPNLAPGATLMLPAPAAARYAATLPHLPQDLRIGWQRLAVGDDAGPCAAHPAHAEICPRLNPERATTQLVWREPPPSVPGAERADHYVVRAGDSLWRIARRFRLSVESLANINGLPPGAVLRPGQRLRISSP